MAEYTPLLPKQRPESDTNIISDRNGIQEEKQEFDPGKDDQKWLDLLSRLETLQKQKAREMKEDPVYSGEIWLLEQVIDRLGLDESLIKLLEDRNPYETNPNLLLVALYLICYDREDQTLADWLVERFQVSHQQIRDLFALLEEIREEDLLAYSKNWLLGEGASNLDEHNIIYVVESGSQEQGEMDLSASPIDVVLKGRRLPKETRQIQQERWLAAMAYNSSDQLPFFFKRYPRHEQKTQAYFRELPTLFEDCKQVGLNDFILLSPRGYHDLSHLGPWLALNQKLIAPVSPYWQRLEDKVDLSDFFNPEETGRIKAGSMLIREYPVDASFLEAVDGTELPEELKTMKIDSLRLIVYLDPTAQKKQINHLHRELSRQKREVEQWMQEDKISWHELTHQMQKYSLLDFSYDPDALTLESLDLEESNEKSSESAASKPASSHSDSRSSKRGNANCATPPVKPWSWQVNTAKIERLEKTAGLRALLVNDVDQDPLTLSQTWKEYWDLHEASLSIQDRLYRQFYRDPAMDQIAADDLTSYSPKGIWEWRNYPEAGNLLCVLVARQLYCSMYQVWKKYFGKGYETPREILDILSSISFLYTEDPEQKAVLSSLTEMQKNIVRKFGFQLPPSANALARKRKLKP